MNQSRIHHTYSDRLDCDQTIGSREEQQDAYRIAFVGSHHSNKKQILLVVCDGMGGHTDGALASKVVADSFVSAFRPNDSPIQDRLLTALEHSNKQLSLTVAADIKTQGMGSTLLAAVLSENSIQWISVGDSVLLVYRDGAVKQLNADHSMRSVLDDLAASGRITESEAIADTRRSSLLSAVMGEDIAKIDAPNDAIALQERDVVILASDGLTTISDADIAAICSRAGATAADITREILNLISAASTADQDNTTLICHKVDGNYPLSQMVSQMEAQTLKPA